LITEILAYLSVGLIIMSWVVVVLVSLITKARQKRAPKKTAGGEHHE